MPLRRLTSFLAGPHAPMRALGALGLLACGGEGSREREVPPAMAGSGLTPMLAMEMGGIDEDGELVLDELTDGDASFASGGISGEWFTYSDGTRELTPPDHTGLPSVDGEAHVSGQGFSEWGAGVSAYFRSANLSAFERLRLRVRGAGSIVVEIATPATSPTDEGGTCMGAGCFGHFAGTVELTEQYQDFDLPFSSFAQPSWAQPAELSLDGVISINLVAKVVGGVANIDLWVDRLSLHAAPADAP